MIEAIGDIVGGSRPQRECTPVRRQSRAAGRCEGAFWRRTDRQTVRKVVLAARRYELATRQPGARNGALGSVALEILELFANLVDCSRIGIRMISIAASSNADHTSS